MVAQTPQKRTIIRWTTLRGFTALFIFIILAVIAEYLIVLFATSLGVKDENPLQWTFKFPATEWNITLAISPLFHLVPITAVVALASSWTYLARRLAIRHPESRKEKTLSRRGKNENRVDRFLIKVGSAVSNAKGISYVIKKVRFARPTVRSAFIVLIIFMLFILAVSVLTYPKLIHNAVANAYKSNPVLLSFVRNTGAALSQAGSIFSGISNGLIATSPGFRSFALSAGNLIAPLASMDNAAKYLVFQNAAAWISVFLVLLYGEYGRRSYRYKKK